MQTMVIACALLGLLSDPPVSESEFFRLMEGLHAPFRDISLICEGTSTFIGPKSLLEEGANRDMNYQCQYYYRQDGATRTDMYIKSIHGDSILSRSTRALLGNRLEELSGVPDSKDLAQVRVRRGDTAAFRSLGATHNILYIWLFRWMCMRGGRNFESPGWEEVDGHRCLRVELDFLPGFKAPSKLRVRAWLDVARGGHPLRIELRRGVELLWQAHDIKLLRFQLPGGGEAYLPVDGVLDSYSFNWKSYQEPIMRDTYHVVTDTVRLNRGLTDRIFSVAWKDGTPESAGMQRMRREFDQAAIRARASRPLRDPDSVRERLDKQLAEAGQQAKMLEASAVARSGWAWATVLPYGLSIGGVTLLGFVAFVKWRMH